MVKIIITELDKFDVSLKKFKRACVSSGLYTTIRNKAFNMAPAMKRRKKKLAAQSYVLLCSKREVVKYKKL